MLKNEIRNKYKKIRNQLSAVIVAKKSDEIIKTVLESQEYAKAQKLFMFVNTGNEVVTTPLISQAINSGKKVAVPKMSDKKGVMEFIEITTIEELSPNKYSILEPEYNAKRVLEADEKTIIIVPALAVDKKGYRVGYGGGYYDRYMAKYKTLANIAVAFDVQLIEEAPHEEFDVAVDIIITESGRIEC